MNVTSPQDRLNYGHDTWQCKKRRQLIFKIKCYDCTFRSEGLSFKIFLYINACLMGIDDTNDGSLILATYGLKKTRLGSRIFFRSIEFCE